MRLFYSLVVLLSAVAFVAAAPYPKQLGATEVAVANEELQPLPRAQLKANKRTINPRSRTIAHRRGLKKRALFPGRAGDSSNRPDPESNTPKDTGRDRPNSNNAPEGTRGARPVSNTEPTETGRTKAMPNSGANAPEAPPEEDEDGKGVKKHKKPAPKKHKKKKKQPKPKKDKDEESNTDDTGSDDDPGTDNASEDASGTDRD